MSDIDDMFYLRKERSHDTGKRRGGEHRCMGRCGMCGFQCRSSLSKDRRRRDGQEHVELDVGVGGNGNMTQFVLYPGGQIGTRCLSNRGGGW